MSHTASVTAAHGPGSITLVRIITGLFYLPHVWSKIVGFAGTAGFFGKAGFQPPEFFVVLAGSAELLIGLGLVFGIFTKYAALGSAILMAVAAYAIIAVSGVGWYWSRGGVEYLVFWLLVSLVIFRDAWRRQPGLFGLFR